MIRPVRSVLPILALVCALPAAAQVYRWVDPDGSIHYSDNPDAAPKGAKITKTQGDDISVGPSIDINGDRNGVQEKPTASSESTRPASRSPSTSLGMNGSSSSSVATGATAPPPPQEDETSEATVRAKFRQTFSRIADLEKQLPAAQKAVDEADAAVGLECRASKLDCMTWDERVKQNRQDARDKLAKLQADIREWKTHLDDLDRWASSKAIPRAWRQ
jgi:hypothetical protein